MMRQLKGVLLAVLMSCGFFANASSAQESPRPSSPQEVSLQPGSTPVEVRLVDVESGLFPGSDRGTIILRLSMKLKITNTSAKTLSVARSQFELFAADKPVEAGMYDSNTELVSRQLKPGESTVGTVAFGFKYLGQEPKLELVWTQRDVTQSDVAPPAPPEPGDDGPEDTKTTEPSEQQDSGKKSQENSEGSKPSSDTPSIRMPLNDVFEQLNKSEILALGPDGCLIQIATPRLMDTLAIWSMAKTLEGLAKNKHERILIVPQPNRPVRVMGEYVTWLATLVDGQSLPGQERIPFPEVSAKFKSIAIAGIQQTANGSFYRGRRGLRIHQTVNEAIVDALLPVYRFVPVENALRDLQSPVVGVQSAAIAGVIDRLSESQASMILEKARSGDESMQLMIVPYLNLLPGRTSVETLKVLALSPNANVSGAAIDTLCACPDDSAISAMAEVWKASETSPDMRSVILGAIGRHPDERWIPLARDYVAVFLTRATQPDAPNIEPQSIASALGLLQGPERIQVCDLVQRALPEVKNLELQDTLLEFMMTVDVPDRAKVVRQIANERITNKKLSTAVLRAAMLYPDSSWTFILLEESLAKKTVRGYERSIRSALNCANAQQLETVVSRMESMDSQQQLELLNHLSKTEYKGWQELAGKVLEHEDRFSIEAVQLLMVDASDESLRILRTNLETYVKELEGTKDASIEGSQYFVKLGDAVADFTDPECRRLINRLARDQNEFVAETAKANRWKIQDILNSPSLEVIRAESEARQAGQDDKIPEFVAKRMEADPFLADNYIRRASEHMHAKRFQESMQDLQRADQLSPEDIEVLSMIALLKIRLGETAAGLTMADEIITMAPKDWTAVYNGACTYSRAAEAEEQTEQKSKYADKAIELLQHCAKDLKFNDFKHMQKDEDLVELHKHPMWAQTVSMTEANKDEAIP